MMQDLNHLLDGSAEYEKIASAVEIGTFPFHVVGAAESGKAHLIASLCANLQRHALIVTHSELEAQRIADDLHFFTQGNAVLIPPKEIVLYKVEAATKSSEFERMAALKRFGEGAIGVASIASFLHFVVPKDEFDSMRLFFAVGGVVEIETLLERFVAMGYSRAETVEGVGQFAVRGGIIDVAPPDGLPIRMELFGDEIDSIRTFDLSTQLSLDKLQQASLIPASPPEEAGSMLSYLDRDALLFFDEPQRIGEAAEVVAWELTENRKALAERGVEVEEREYLHDYRAIVRRSVKKNLVAISALSRNCPDFKVKATLPLTMRVLQSYSGNIQFFYDDMALWREQHACVTVLGGSSTRAKQLAQELRAREFSAQYWERGESPDSRRDIVVIGGSIQKGFEYPLIRSVVVSDREIFAQEKKKRKMRRDASSAKIKDLDKLELGDYVVHQVHGIGRYLGLVRLTVEKTVRDYIKIEYRGEDYLYVPVDRLDLIGKYTGGEASKVRLNKLGGVEWANAKRRVKQSVADMADRLVKLYAEREQAQGHAFHADTPWQRQFEDAFPFEETPDQLQCISEIKEDMERARPMDRLLCGDVGFGKTEVAMRAAFKAVQESFQVAYLVPTTILASQHYNNFVQRMKDFPVSVRMLSRFTSAKENQETLRMLKNGECDIVVGTHKLLQKSVEFKNLGLLIVDEEQRFGVAHKERIKEMRKNVDVLTLSATPIPRTLHMAMVGIRDMSVLTSPPEDRYPVQTYVLEYNEAVIQNAIHREIGRGGQVYYLSNRVRGLDKIAHDLSEMIPDARVAVAHGKMTETQLESTMMQMQAGEIDILVCTTIIETGLDIPNVNTIIVENADALGLSQLYQLRGRVGRSNRLAYAYCTFRRNKVLDEVAEKRLRAIREFTEFGSGFKLAMRDLEIRGAGNVLGPEQHGFMASVGYDMYCSILNEAVNEAMGKPSEQKTQETEFDLPISAFIPEDYIRTSDLRIEAYRRIASISDLADSYRVEEELEDRYGDVPHPTRLLMEIALLRAAAKRVGVTEITKGEAGVVFYLDSLRQSLDAITQLAVTYKGSVLYGAGERPYILYRTKDFSEATLMRIVNNVLQGLQTEEASCIIENNVKKEGKKTT